MWILAAMLACGSSNPEGSGEEKAPPPEVPVYAKGLASWYGAELEGRPTASGEPFDPAGLTAAHRTLPLGTRVRVTNPKNARSVDVTINDRGPFKEHRILDLSRGAAERIGLVDAGQGKVELRILECPEGASCAP